MGCLRARRQRGHILPQATVHSSASLTAPSLEQALGQNGKGALFQGRRPESLQRTTSFDAVSHLITNQVSSRRKLVSVSLPSGWRNRRLFDLLAEHCIVSAGRTVDCPGAPLFSDAFAAFEGNLIDRAASGIFRICKFLNTGHCVGIFPFRAVDICFLHDRLVLPQDFCLLFDQGTRKPRPREPLRRLAREFSRWQEPRPTCSVIDVRWQRTCPRPVPLPRTRQLRPLTKSSIPRRRPFTRG